MGEVICQTKIIVLNDVPPRTPQKLDVAMIIFYAIPRLLLREVKWYVWGMPHERNET